jgi:hypothetical protein
MATDQHRHTIFTDNTHASEYGHNVYNKIYELLVAPSEIYLGDHLGGFDQQYRNQWLDYLDNIATDNCVVWHDQIFDNKVTSNYSNLTLNLNFPNWLWNTLQDYTIHPEIHYKNFICSFNGSLHISRVLLVSILEKFGYFNSDYCSKNFLYSEDDLSGHIRNYVPETETFYRKFFISDTSDNFFESIYSFGHMRFNHQQNIYKLQSKITESFLHIVSETMATSYYPFVTEKFLYSIVTRGLFLAYAQPGWHAHVEKYYGFKRYTKLFDYKFDTIQNPVERLLELMSMISKFSKLSSTEWHDLYLLELDTIEYNYNHYYSKNYMKVLSNV